MALSYAQLDLQKAQLGMQMNNAATNAELERLKIAQSAQATTAGSAIAAAKLAQDYAQANATSYDKSVKQDLDEREYQLKLFKQKKELEDEQKLREQDTNSGRLEQEGMVALNSDDPTKLIEWTNKVAGALLTQKQRNDVYNNAMALVNSKKELEQQGVNIKTRSQAIGIVQGLNMLDVNNLTPDQFAGTMQQATDDFRALGNTDKNLNDVFMSVSQDLAKRQTDFRQKEYGQALNSFLRTASIGELDPGAQKDWDKLQEEFPDDQTRVTSSAYSERVRRSMFQYNKKKSIDQLKSMEAQNATIAENIITQNPALAATKVDPQTKETYRVFPYATPDLTPVVGSDGSIDPDTGLLTKSVLDANKKWTAEVTSPSFLLGQVPFIRGLNMAPVPTVPAGGGSTASTAPFRIESRSKFDLIPEAGTAQVVTGPARVAPEISLETINNIVTAYRANPEAIIYGRPAREIIAVLKAKGYSIPDALVTPGQTR